MEDLLLYLAKSAGLITAFYICYILLLKSDTNFQLKRKYLVAGLITSAILPGIYFTREVLINLPSTTVGSSVSINQNVVNVPIEEQISWSSVLAVIYFMGTAIMIVRFAVQLYSLYKLISEGEVERRNNTVFVKVGKEIAPFSFLNYIVFNPKLHNSKDIQYILEHEKVHTSQWHSIDVLLSNLNLIFQWFNPLAWMYDKKLHENLEFIADSEAAKSADCKKEYQKALVQISTNNFHPSITNNFYQSFIKKRIVMLNNNKSSKNSIWKAQLILPVLLAFMLVFNVKTVAQINNTPTSYAQDSAKDSISISAEINKNSSRESLEKVQNIFQKRGVELSFENLEFSSEGLLTEITARFLNKKTGQNGMFSKKGDDGINPFEVFVNEKNETGFREEKNMALGTVEFNEGISLEKLGKNLLYVVNGKEFTTAELKGKAITTKSQLNILIPEYAVKEYGNKAKDGAVIIAEGTIGKMSDLMKKIDQENQQEELNFVQINGEFPVFGHVSNNPGKKTGVGITNPKVKTKIELSSVAFETRKPSEIKEVYKNQLANKKHPLIIVDGVAKDKNFDLKSIAPEQIESFNVISGKNLVKAYGKRAKDGLILITTKKAGNKRPIFSVGIAKGVQVYDTPKNNSSSWAERAISGNANYYPSETTTSISGEAKIINTNSPKDSEKNYKMVKADSAININASNILNSTKISTNTGKNYALIVVDGEIQKPGFDLNSYEIENIEAITVLKGEKAIKKYGKRGKKGVVEINLKTKNEKENKSSDAYFLLNITKASTNNELEKIKQYFKKTGLEVSFEELQRDKNGMITHLKILGKNKSGSASATFDVNSGIPDVYLGQRGNTIIISSNPPE